MFLLLIIYLGFVSLGLPNSLFGAAWPVLQAQMHMPLSYAGFVTMTVSGGTIVASLLSDRLTFRFGAGRVTAFSVCMTAAALLGFSRATEFWMLILFAVPLGLGAGAVDAALNNFVALHYSSRHMSWLHCFWDVGCALSPYIMSFYLHRNTDWQGGYRAISVLQLGLTVMLFLSLPLWKKQIAETESGEKRSAKPIRKLLRQHGAVQALLSFFSYCALESTAGLWASSFLVQSRGITAETAARFASLFYIGITAGRFLSGFIADRFGDRRMIRFGLCGITSGVFLILLPLPQILTLTGLIVIGFGCAPVYPCMIHATPAVFGREASQQMIGLQMAFAYIGTTLMPPLFGFIADRAGLGMLPLFLAFFLVLMALLTEQMYQTKRN